MNRLHIFKRFVIAVLSVMLLATSCVDNLSVFNGRKKARVGEFEYTLELSLDNGNSNGSLSTRSKFFTTENGDLTFEDLAENAVVMLYNEDGYLVGSQFVADEYIVELVQPATSGEGGEAGNDGEGLSMASASFPQQGEILRYNSPKKVAFRGGDYSNDCSWRVIVEGWKLGTGSSHTFTFHDIKVNTDYYIYAVGNLPVPSSDDYSSAAAWYEAITDYVVDNFGTVDQLQYYNVTKEDMLSKGLRIPYVHIPADKTHVSNNDEITLPMVRTMAKARININTDALEGEFTLDADGINVRQTPTTCYVFDPGYAAASSSEIDNDGDCCEDGGVVYLYENCQGNLLAGNSTPANKNMSKLSSTGKEGLCTYIEVKGTYTLNDFTTPVTYRFYLGDNNTSNFDVRRNVSRTYTLYLTDDNVLNGGTGWKIDPDKVPEVTSLVITPSTFAMEVGDEQAFAVTAIYNTGRTEVVTPYCGWSASAGLSMSSNVATATAGNNDAYVTATWKGKSVTATGKIRAVEGIELTMPSVEINGYEDSRLFAGYIAMHLQSTYDLDVNQRQLEVYKVWNDGTVEQISDPEAEGVIFTKVSGSANMYLSGAGRLHINITAAETVIRATLDDMTDEITIEPEELTARLLTNSGGYMPDPYVAEMDEILPRKIAWLCDGVKTDWSSSITITNSWSADNADVLQRVSQSSKDYKVVGSGTSDYKATLSYNYTNALGQNKSGNQYLQVTVTVPAAPVIDDPTYDLVVTPATATIAEDGTESFNAILITHHTNGSADDEEPVIASWSLTSGSSYAQISGQGNTTISVANINSTSTTKSATLKASYSSTTTGALSATASLSLAGKSDVPWEELVVAPASASISATGSKDITATIVTHHSNGDPDDSRPATGAVWSITTGSTYAGLNSTTGASVTVTGCNTTYSSQTVVVKASATGLVNATTTSGTCTLTVGAKIPVYTYALEIVPGDNFTLTVGNYKQLKAYRVQYLDGSETSRTDVTSSSTWTSANTSKVTATASGSYENINGVAETTTPVTITCSHTYSGQTYTDDVNVTAVYGNSFNVTGGDNLVWEWNEYGTSQGKTVHVTAPSNKTVTVSYVGGDNYDKFYKSQTSFTGSKDITFYPVGKNLNTSFSDYVAAVRLSCDGFTSVTIDLTQHNGVERALVVEPTSATITYNGTKQYKAYLVYKEPDAEDGETVGEEISRQEVTSQCTWEVRTNTQNATISSTGFVTGTRSDWTGANYMTSSIRAYYDNLIGAASVRVGKAPEVVITYALEVTPATATIAYNGTQQYTATYKTFEDGVLKSSENVTSSCSWSSSNTSAATISASGLASGCNTSFTDEKTTTITATYSGTSDDALLTVSEVPVSCNEISIRSGYEDVPLFPYIMNGALSYDVYLNNAVQVDFEARGEKYNISANDMTWQLVSGSDICNFDANNKKFNMLSTGNVTFRATYGGIDFGTVTFKGVCGFDKITLELISDSANKYSVSQSTFENGDSGTWLNLGGSTEDGVDHILTWRIKCHRVKQNDWVYVFGDSSTTTYASTFKTSLNIMYMDVIDIMSRDIITENVDWSTNDVNILRRCGFNAQILFSGSIYVNDNY